MLVLGLGNLLLTDDGLGLRLLEELASLKSRHWGDQVEFVDGGTQGLALMSELAGRRAVVILDAVGAGADPGTVHLLQSSEAGALDFSASASGAGSFHSDSAHESNARELIATSALLGDAPAHLYVVGIEPHEVKTGIGLTTPVEAAIPQAVTRAAGVVEELLSCS
ncbi:MAG TPA: hydrogenase maturation protease [Bryobacteraceae bacterium]